jgi:hypothetical protein
MSNELSKKEILNEVIIAYRNMVSERYQYKVISERFHVPESFTRERVDQFRNYFLDYVYPSPAVRTELELAFKSLDNFVLHPEKVLRVLMDSSFVLLKHGRHIPRIMSAGLKAFQSFKSATVFEDQLVKSAINNKLSPPFSADNLKQMIQTLSREDIDKFIDVNRGMLETLYDRKLMKEITEVVSAILKNMRKRTRIYSATEIKGLEMGLDMITQGNSLFNQLSKTDQNQIFNLIIAVEVDVLESIFED